jgi:hypothetical protein
MGLPIGGPLMLTLALVALTVYAEDPDPEPDPDPIKAIERFDKATTRKLEEIARQRKALVESLRKRSAAAAKVGKKAEANTLGNAAVLLESLGTTNSLGKLKPADVLKEGSIKGKYSRLLHVLHCPQDAAIYGNPHDFGFCELNSYHSYNGLKGGHWVYFAERWFIWAE